MAALSSSTFAPPNLKMAASVNSADGSEEPSASTAPHNSPPPIFLNRHPRPEDGIDYITVLDPVIHADGINKYTSYRVDCRPPQNPTPESGQPPDAFLQNNQGQFSSVLRRYSDFLWLYNRLHVERPGSIVPPLPEKQAVARFSPEFVEERRKALEKFLRRVVLHPECWDAPSLATFLRADDVSFGAAKAAAEKHEAATAEFSMGDSMNVGGAGAFHLSPKNAQGIKKWFSEAKTQLSNNLVRSPDDDLFDEIERYIEALSVQMKRVSNQASNLVRKGKEVANGMFEFGLGFHQLGQSEGGDGNAIGSQLGSKLQWVGQTADTASGIAAANADMEYHHLEDPFKDYIKTIHAVKLALQRRHDKRVSYTALLHEIETREGNLHRLRLTPGSEAKAYSTEMSLHRYRQAADLARDQFAETSQRVLREVDRFKREKAEEMKYVVMEFILLQIDVNRRMEKVWGELVPVLEGGEAPSTDAQNGAPSGNIMSEGNGTSVGSQPTMVNMPPSQPPPPVPMNQPPPIPSSNQPTYSNVPGPAPMGSNPLMESSIQYRDRNLPGMGL